jgi:hypothetical protein
MKRKTTPALTRLLSRIEIDPETGCWEWQGAKATKGYGLFRGDGPMVRTHRYSYEHLVGPIPDGLTLDHLCRNRACCNPEHLEPCTAVENIQRAAALRSARRVEA